jgi:hypothetical protein
VDNSLSKILENSKGMSTAETLMVIDVLMNSMKVINFEEVYRHSNSLTLLKLLEDSSSVMDIGINMHQNFSVPRWVSISDINLTEIEKRIEKLFQHCPSSEIYRAQILKDFEEYKKALLIINP